AVGRAGHTNQGSSDPENPSGISSASVQLRRSPPGLIAVTTTAPGSGANSSRTWRHAPHGDDGGDASLHTATAWSRCAPASTAANTAVRSAQIARPYDA